MVAKLCLAEISGPLQALQPLQIGVGGKGPVIQAAILAVKSWISTMAADDVLLKVDIANAYNTIDRSACLAGVAKFCPDALRWSKWCLDGTSHVFYDGESIPCSTGVQQGDPLAPSFSQSDCILSWKKYWPIRSCEQFCFWTMQMRPRAPDFSHPLLRAGHYWSEDKPAQMRALRRGRERCPSQFRWRANYQRHRRMVLPWQSIARKVYAGDHERHCPPSPGCEDDHAVGRRIP